MLVIIGFLSEQFIHHQTTRFILAQLSEGATQVEVSSSALRGICGCKLFRSSSGFFLIDREVWPHVSESKLCLPFSSRVDLPPKRSRARRIHHEHLKFGFWWVDLCGGTKFVGTTIGLRFSSARTRKVRQTAQSLEERD